MIYRKLLRLRQNPTMADVANLIAVDLYRIHNGIMYFHYLWSAIPEVLSMYNLLSLGVDTKRRCLH